MDRPTAFAAIALAAVSWDGRLTKAGSRSLRHVLDYRQPYSSWSDGRMVSLMDGLLVSLREMGPEALMAEASRELPAHLRQTAFATAAEIMRSDGSLEEEEERILGRLSQLLGLETQQTRAIIEVMDVLHTSLEDIPL
ncbi:Tellurite resistance protein TerB [Synechococcus sp. RSCCF101]|uniref:tellurite resistance TerB family protein n=1 Tax=Synechococcus sp. RSCCF101 TaxID=2511069 RepID=UPI001246B45C|nr:tellurite resistance TerB family protein [Synechococcus sp. RSCCF101]QEY31273.1 Tellurite resistance protein TerB [Synechococcus sp. RSCCF101]